ncbi:caspase family protein [Nostoc sp. NIES-2111]
MVEALLRGSLQIALEAGELLCGRGTNTVIASVWSEITRPCGGPMRRLLFLFVVAALAGLVHPCASDAGENRVALVIGNAQYRSVEALENPARDARAIAARLEDAGFASVIVGIDLDRAGLVRTLQQFQAIADGADWAVIYFAGHGLQVDGANYVVPVDAALRSDRDVDDETVSLDRLLLAIAGARQIRLVILDACRDNPFQPRMSQAAVRFSGGRGLARVEPGVATMVAYAARDGQVASDGGDHSTFVEALLRRIAAPGLEIGQLFRLVRDDVLASTGGQQEPYVYGSLPGRDFFFMPPQSPTATPQTRPSELPLSQAEEPPLPPRRFAAVLAQAARQGGDAAGAARIDFSASASDLGRKQALKVSFGGRRSTLDLASALAPHGLPDPGFAAEPAGQHEILAELQRAGCRTGEGLSARTLASLRAFSACTKRTVLADPATATDLAFMRSLEPGVCSRSCAPTVASGGPAPRRCGTAGKPACHVAAKAAKPAKKSIAAPIVQDVGEAVLPPAALDWTPEVGSSGSSATGVGLGSNTGGGQIGGMGGQSRGSPNNAGPNGGGQRNGRGR